MQNILSKAIKFSLYSLTFLLPIFFLPFSFEVFEFNKQYLLFFLVSLAFLSWMAKMVLVEKKIKFKRTLLDIPILVILFVSLLSAIFSVDWVSSIFGFYGRFSNGLIGLMGFIMMYFLIANNSEASSSSEDEKKTLLRQPTLIKLFLTSSLISAILAYFSSFGLIENLFGLLNLTSKVPAFLQQRIFNLTAGSMEGLAVFLAIISVFVIGLILSQKNKWKVFYWAILVLSFGLILMIDSVASWIVLFTSLAIFLIFAMIKKIFSDNVNWLLLPIIIVIASFIFLFININVLQLPKEQVLGQVDSWKIGIGGATENIKSGVLGSGIGTWHYDFSKFKPKEFNQTVLWQYRFDRSGSYVSEILGSTGFLGLVSYLFLAGVFLLAFWFSLSYKLRSKDLSQIPLFLAFLAVLISQFVYYQNTVLAFAFWFILALSVSGWQKPSSEKEISLKGFPELSLAFTTLFIVTGLAVLGMYFFAARFYLADVNFKNALVKDDIQKMETATRLNSLQAQYKIVLARKYLVQALTEAQNASGEGSNSIILATAYAKGDKASNIKGATEVSPNWVAGWETLGVIYRDVRAIVNNPDSAIDFGIASFGKALDLEPTNPVLRTELAKLYMAKEQSLTGEEYYNSESIKKAEEELIRAVDNKQDYVEALFELGILYYNSNTIDRAISYLEKAIAVAPNYSNARYVLGLAYAKNTEKDKAIAQFEIVLQLNPGNEDVQAKLNELKK